MVLCRHETSRCLNQYWPKDMSLRGVAKQQRVNVVWDVPFHVVEICCDRKYNRNPCILFKVTWMHSKVEIIIEADKNDKCTPLLTYFESGEQLTSKKIYIWWKYFQWAYPKQEKKQNSNDQICSLYIIVCQNTFLYCLDDYTICSFGVDYSYDLVITICISLMSVV